MSGNWGWTDPVTGHDIAIIGRQDGTAFVDVTDPVKPRYLGDLMRTKGANMSSWREIKTYKNYALIVSDGSTNNAVQGKYIGTNASGTAAMCVGSSSAG